MNPPQARPAKATLAQALKRAEISLRASRLDDAAQICEAILRDHADQPAALHFLGLIAKQRGRIADAEGFMRRSIASNPREPAFHSNLGNLLRSKEDFAGAETSYCRALELNPNFASAHCNLGITLKSLGRPAEALDAFCRAVECDPNYAEAHTYIGLALKEKKEFENALTCFDKAIALKPDYFDAHYYRGTTLSLLARYPEAIAALERAKAINPQSHEAVYALGSALQYVGRDDDALAAYWQAIEAKPGFMPAHYDFNSLAWAMGRKELCLRSYAYARTRDGETADLLLSEAEVRTKLGLYPRAEELARRAFEIAPQRPEIAGAIGRALAGQHKHVESTAFFQEALRADPNSVPLLQEFAIAHLQAGNASEAKKILEGALALAPVDQLTLGALCLAYRELGDDRYRRLVDPEKHIGIFEIPLPRGFPDARAFNLALAEELDQLHTRKVAPLDQTLRGGTQTAGNLFDAPTKLVAAARDSIAECVAKYIASMPTDSDHPLYSRKQDKFTFSGSWSCRLNSSGFHTNHVHPKGWISSAYYAHVPGETEDAVARQGWLKFGESNMLLNERDKPHRHVRPIVGHLALFPSYFWHGTVPFTSSESRITMAFDVVPGVVRFGEAPLRPY